MLKLFLTSVLTVSLSGKQTLYMLSFVYVTGKFIVWTDSKLEKYLVPFK